jgi:hypothetical protein
MEPEAAFGEDDLAESLPPVVERHILGQPPRAAAHPRLALPRADERLKWLVVGRDAFVDKDVPSVERRSLIAAFPAVVRNPFVVDGAILEKKAAEDVLRELAEVYGDRTRCGPVAVVALVFVACSVTHCLRLSSSECWGQIAPIGSTKSRSISMSNCLPPPSISPRA